MTHVLTTCSITCRSDYGFLSESKTTGKSLTVLKPGSFVRKLPQRNLLRGRGMNGIGQFDRELGANLGGRDEDGPRNGEQFQADRWLQNLLVGALPGDVPFPKRLHQHFGERELTRECLNLLTIHGLQQNGYTGLEVGIAFQRIDENNSR